MFSNRCKNGLHEQMTVAPSLLCNNTWGVECWLCSNSEVLKHDVLYMWHDICGSGPPPRPLTPDPLHRVECRPSLPSHSVAGTSAMTARTVFYTDGRLTAASSPGSWTNAGFFLETLQLRHGCRETAACRRPLTRTLRFPHLWWLEKSRQSPTAAPGPGEEQTTPLITDRTLMNWYIVLFLSHMLFCHTKIVVRVKPLTTSSGSVFVFLLFFWSFSILV